MKFKNATEVDQICYQMKMADWPRAQNRALINNLFNGMPPNTAEEVERDNININVNFLEGPVIAHEGRTQFYGAFLKPGRYFNCTTDAGPAHKRSARSATVTREINKIMKNSLKFYECFRSKFALNVLHGIGPSIFRDQDAWCPIPLGVEDVMLPSNTLLTMENVPFFALYRSFTAPELLKLAKGPKPDPGWDQGQVNAILEWIDQESMSLMSTNWPEIWSPEKAAERIKSDGGIYLGDAVPTVNVWDFYYYSDESKKTGWRRRMILDAWSTPSMQAGRATATRMKRGAYSPDKFLYDSGSRVFGDEMGQIVNFQFADLSCYAPFRYHSVRSLGFLLYATCHLQNRLRCKFYEAVFESLMMYFKVRDLDEAQRALKLELVNRGFIDDTLTPIPANERYMVNAQLVELGLQENRSLISRHSSSYSPVVEAGGKDKREKTKFEVQAEIQQMTSLVGAALLQAYAYQAFEYREVFRRFCRKRSGCPDVRKFQARCAAAGVPLDLLRAENWEITPERVMGAGNKTLEMVIAEQLMSFRPLYDPTAQRTILREVTQAITDDPARAESLVPEQPEISDSVHDAQLRWGTLMAGAPVNIKDGTNHTEIIETLLKILGQHVMAFEQAGQLPDMKELAGFNNVANHIMQEIQVVAADPNEKQRVRQYGQQLGQIMNLLKAFQQRIQQAMQQAQQNGQAGMDPKELAKIEAMKIQAQAKAENTRESHAQRTAQRQVQFEMEVQQDQQRHEMEMQREAAKSGQKMASDTMLTQQELAAGRALTRDELAANRAFNEQDIEAARRKNAEKSQTED